MRKLISPRGSQEGEEATLAQAIDVHYAVKSLHGWPKMWLQAWALDEAGDALLCGYGVANVPCEPGLHEIEVHLWQPEGDMLERAGLVLLGRGPRLVHEDAIHSPSSRYRLGATSAGTVKLNLGIIAKEFDRFGIAAGPSTCPFH